ncbi:josephin-2-like [Styela clava]|uniref:josephin-2-like n=1 Tax=Styela clava TaxID=7725 RepID=UPI001939E62E|nr:josephin-2-like [Styela clava]
MSCLPWKGHSRHMDANDVINSIYHERQRYELCALHALNNIFQDPNAFSKEILDDICYKLSPDTMLNPHKSVLGTGDYDVNVIMAALQSKGYAAIWWDKRKNISSLHLPSVKGLMLNIPSEIDLGLFKLPLKRRHWIALLAIDEVFYNLDSKLKKPSLIGGRDLIRAYLEKLLGAKNSELLLVVDNVVEQTREWKTVTPNNSESSLETT